MKAAETEVKIMTKLLSHDIPVRLRCQVLGNCMVPTTRNGDLITLVPADKLRIGDMVVFHSSQMVMHRVVGFSNQQVITKGDVASDFDPPLPQEKVLGKVIAISRSGKTLQLTDKIWQTFNYLLAKYSLISGTVCRKLSKHKRAKALAHKILSLPLILFRKLIQ